MEVRVDAFDGLPDGCLVSIRAGQSRRQAMLPLQAPLRFPCLPFNAKPFKVDILAPLGSARLSLNGSACEEKYSVPITMAGGRTGKIGLTVVEQPAICGKRVSELKDLDDMRPANEGGPSKIDIAVATREYLDRHNLAPLVQELLQSVLRERPDQPYDSMAQFMARRAAEVRGKVPEAAPEVQAENEPTGDAAGEALRAKASATFCNAAADGRLETALVGTKEVFPPQEEAQGVETGAREASFVEPETEESEATDDRFEAALLRVQNEKQPTKEKTAPTEQKTAPPKTAPTEQELRAKARATFSGAAKSGKLDAALVDTRKPTKEEADAKAQKEADAKAKTKTTLCGAALNGKLEAALVEIQMAPPEAQGEEEEPRSSTPTLDDKLEAALKKAHQENESALARAQGEGKEAPALAEGVRAKALATFGSAAQDGRLEAALQEAMQEKMEPLRDENARLKRELEELRQEIELSRFQQQSQA